MAIAFPPTPAADEEFTSGALTWVWKDGQRWDRKFGVPPLQILSIVPPDGLVGADIPVSIFGISLTPTCKVWLAGAEQPTTYVSAGELRTTMPASATPQTIKVWVIDGATTAIPTTGLDFTYKQIPMILTSLNPSGAQQHASNNIEVELIGSGFNANCYSKWSGELWATTYVSPTKLIANLVMIRDVGVRSVIAWDSQTQAESNAIDFPVTSNQPPALISVNPNSAQQGTTIATLTVTGTNFINGKRIKWNGVAVPTTYVNATTLTTPNVLVPYSPSSGSGSPRVPVEVEECPGILYVNAPGANGSVTIDANVAPGAWPHPPSNVPPWYNNNYVKIISGEQGTAQMIVHMDGLPYPSWPEGNVVWFTPDYKAGQDPATVWRPKVTLVNNGVPSANHAILPIGGV